jgi:hypothetical protein
VTVEIPEHDYRARMRLVRLHSSQAPTEPLRTPVERLAVLLVELEGSARDGAIAAAHALGYGRTCEALQGVLTAATERMGPAPDIAQTRGWFMVKEWRESLTAVLAEILEEEAWS